MALVVWAGDRLHVTTGNPSSDFDVLLSDSPESLARAIDSDLSLAVGSLARDPRLPRDPGAVYVLDAPLKRAFERVGRPCQSAPIGQFRAARRSSFVRKPRELRSLILDLADLRVRTRLQAPEEVLISLAREEERVERALLRETSASDPWIVAGPELEAYDHEWRQLRRSLADHHARLVTRVEGLAARVVPNLAAVVGARVAARLIARAGGISPLARMSSSRLQLLGSLRRPAADRTPRFGVLFRAEGMEAVPPDRRGAYARSLAALAVVAVRADATTHADLSSRLVERRDCRILALRGKARP